MPKKNALSSSLLMLSASWISKGLGLISTVILARILSPEDFGLVAIAMLVVYFFDIFSQTGTQQYLLSKDRVSMQDIDTAWTLNIITKLVVSFFILIFSAPLAIFFDADLKLTLIVCSLIPIVIGLENPSLNLAKREFNYQQIFKLKLVAKFIGFITTISFAMYNQSHWAMIFGTISYFSILTIGSFIISDYMPKISFTNVKHQWNYSKWIFFRGVIGYGRAKGDSFIIAKYFTIAEVGLFSVAKEFAMLVYEQIALPIGEIIITSIQRAKNDNNIIQDIIEKYTTILISILLPIITILALYSEEIILQLLGNKWLDAAPLLSVFTILGITSSITIIFTATLNALKKTKKAFQIDLVTTAIILGTLVIAKETSLWEFSMIRALLGLVVLFSYVISLKKVTGIALPQLFNSITPAIIATLVMSLVLIGLSQFALATELKLLILYTLLAFSSYFLTLLFILNIHPAPSKTLIDIQCYLNKSSARLFKQYRD